MTARTTALKSSTPKTPAKQPRAQSNRRESIACRTKRADSIVAKLAHAYPGAACSLNFTSPFELIVATILSAQCTDKRVNLVTPPLFFRWPTPAAMAAANPKELEVAIHSTGFFRAKAKNIRGCCQALVERHGGEVPQQLEDLIRLPGVGRKTANVVLGCAFGMATGVVVDTHVGRIARRLGLTQHESAVSAERDLMRVLPESQWIAFSHRLIEHGRSVCQSRTPDCAGCFLADLCPRKGLASARKTVDHK
ncbi:MAG: endonuclease III [Planctomycetia bacterium]|nr:endonuclease III [Planctomycetia bacterium]